jgi:carbon-monoxide dehydrogenase medium subunit
MCGHARFAEARGCALPHPVLMALDAQIVTASTSGSRALAIADLYKGYYETSLARNELISEVIVPSQRGRRAAYIKLTTRAADDWPTLGIAVSLTIEGNTVEDPRIVVSAATLCKGLPLISFSIMMRHFVIFV